MQHVTDFLYANFPMQAIPISMPKSEFLKNSQGEAIYLVEINADHWFSSNYSSENMI